MMGESCQQRSCQTSRASKAKLLISRRGSSGCHDMRRTSTLNMYKPRALHTHTHTLERKIKLKDGLIRMVQSVTVCYGPRYCYIHLKHVDSLVFCALFVDVFGFLNYTLPSAPNIRSTIAGLQRFIFHR